MRALECIGSGGRLRVQLETICYMELALSDPGSIAPLMHSFWQKAGAEFAAALQADGMAVGPGVFLNDFSAGDKFEVMEKLGEISLAVLAVVGTEDVMAPVMYAQLMVEKMQNANIASIEGGAQSVPSGVPG